MQNTSQLAGFSVAIDVYKRQALSLDANCSVHKMAKRLSAKALATDFQPETGPYSFIIGCQIS